jgi:A/G-specific adenine glycosylase
VVPQDFARRILRWHKRHGRHDLPWQAGRDPYAVWVSEVMLQQTQVSTVLDYFPRFMRRFPNVRSLARAPLDEVLAQWSGLGYYRRARMLHLCAQQVMQNHNGEFPTTARELLALPGIGRSTAAAIASLCFGERVAVMDGNVRRVLARVLAFDLDLSQARHETALWDQAQELLPRRNSAARMPRYTQGVMDLGATVCLARKPLCDSCPVLGLCLGQARGTPERFPVKSRKLRRGSQQLWLLHAVNAAGDVWLTKRPTSGIWAGLYCLPGFDTRESLSSAVGARAGKRLLDLPDFTHVLTHRDLHIYPVRLLTRANLRLGPAGAWHPQSELAGIGLPAPVRKLLQADPAAGRPGV